MRTPCTYLTKYIHYIICKIQQMYQNHNWNFLPFFNFLGKAKNSIVKNYCQFKSNIKGRFNQIISRNLSHWPAWHFVDFYLPNGKLKVVVTRYKMIISTTNKMVIKPTMIKLVIFTLSILSLVKFPTPNDFGNDRRYSF